MKLNISRKIIVSFIILTILATNFAPLFNVIRDSNVYANSTTNTVEKTLKYNFDKKTLSLGKTIRYTPIKKGFDTKEKISYNSSNSSVATVDENGKVTGVARGNTTITANLDGMSASYELTVVPGTVSIYSGETNEKVKGTVVLEKNENRSYYMQDDYKSILDSEIEWKSSKESVCSVDDSGNISTIDNGNATITASLKEIPKVKGNVRISVKTPVEEIQADDDIITYVGETADIWYLVLPEDASNSRLKFEVQDKNIATVTSQGQVKGKAAGTTTIKVSSVSNPEITTEVGLEVREERDYKEIKTSSIIKDYESSTGATTVSASDGSYRVAKNETISILNDYGVGAKFVNNNKDIISFTSDDNTINVKGLKDGVATISVDYSGMHDIIKIISGNYIDKTVLKKTKTENDGTAVEKIKLGEDPDDSTKEIDYVKDYPLEVGVGYNLTLKISPMTASIDDLDIRFSNTKDFTFEDGMIKALNPNKTTDLIVTSKSNSKVTKKIKLKSSIGNVSQVYFARSYVGENNLDINDHEKYGFNPVFIMESGKKYDPIADPEIENDPIYKELKKNVKITTEDTDIATVSSNILTIKKDVNGAGILKIEYNKMKNARATKDSPDIVSETSFETIGKVIETIKSIKFAKKEYILSPGEKVWFNPIIHLSSGRTLDPTKEGVAESEEYQQFLSQIGLCNGTINDKYTAGDGLVNYTYLENGNTNNIINCVYEGTCKIKMVVHSDNSKCDETVLNIRSPYITKNEEKGLKLSKIINATNYVNTDKLVVNLDGKGDGEAGSLNRGDAIWVFEKYTNGYVRVQYGDNPNLYVESKYLADNKEKTVKKETKSSSSSSTSSKSNSSNSSSSNRGKVTEINEYRWVSVNGTLNIRSGPSTSSSVIGSLSNGAKILVYDKDSNEWAKIKSGSTIGYVKADYLYIQNNNTNSSRSNTTKKAATYYENTQFQENPNTRYVVEDGAVGSYGFLEIKRKKFSKGTKVKLVKIKNDLECYVEYEGVKYLMDRRNLSRNRV